MAAPRSQAQCPGPQPAFSAVVNQQPQLLAACITVAPGGGCAIPAPPVVDVSRTHAQETTLTATVPSGFTATSAHWLLQKWNGTTWETLWSHRSFEGTPLAGGAPVTFGAPGLVEGTNHQARVGFCDNRGTPNNTADDYCFCWSDPATFATTALADLGPAKPASPMLQKIEDRFDRPNTAPKCIEGVTDANDPDLGNGLGPIEVWADCIVGEGETVRIFDRRAWTTPSSFMYYTRQTATHPNSYTDLKVRVDDFGAGYNLEVGTRIVPRSVGPMQTELTGYYLKLALGPLECEQPTMMLARLPAEYGSAKCNLSPAKLVLPTNGCPPGTPDPNRPNKCDCKPPLDEPDGTTGYSQPIWMRVEAWDVEGQIEPRYTGAIAWGTCPAGQPMSVCDYYCAFPAPRVDLGDPQFMRGAQGTWGAFFHEHNYAVEVFDAGSQPAP